MSNLYKLETTVASWYRSAPHLPDSTGRWIATNLWWLTLLGVILSGIGAFFVLVALFTGAAVVGLSGGLDSAIGSTLLLILFITFGFTATNVVVAAIAISPLKSMRKIGWTLLFIAALINVLSLVVSFIFNGQNFFTLVFGLIFAAAGGYFLFEIRDYYQKTTISKRSKLKKT